MFFKLIINKITKKLSFSLVESAITVAVMGTIAGATISAYHSTNPQVRNDAKKMEKIEEALQQFFTINGRLPFPANPTISTGNDDYLREFKGNPYNYSKENYFCGNSTSLADGGQTIDSCISSNGRACCPNNIVLWGVVPVRSLGLPDSYAYDSQGHNFEYITHSALTFSNGTPFVTDSGKTKYYKKTSYSQNNQNKNANGKYSVYFTTNDTRYPSIFMPIKRLSIYSNSQGAVIPETENNTAYVIMSKGKTSKCYFDAKNNVIENTLPPDSTSNNCVENYGNQTTTERIIHQGYSSQSFDNLVKYKTLDELVSINAVNKTNSDNLSLSATNLPQYQLKKDVRLKTDSKEIVKALNELKQRVDELEFGIDACSDDAKNNGLYVANNTLNKINDDTKSKNLALWAPGKYKFPADACIRGYYNNVEENWQLPISRAGELNIRTIRAQQEPNVLSSSSQYRFYEYIDYKGHRWTAYHYGTFTNDMRLNWSVTCDSVWPIGSIYITINIATANDVKKKLGSFSITTGAMFQAISTSSSNVFQTPTCSSNVYEHTGEGTNGAGMVNMDFSKATGSLHSDSCTTIIPSAIKVYIWKRTA